MNDEPVTSVENGGGSQQLLQDQLPDVGKSDWMDIGDFSSLVCELKATVTLAEKWIIIQHARFDLSIDSEPYHASQVLVNQETKEYIIRVWGKTFKKGTVASISELQDILKSALGNEATCCPGHYTEGLSSLFGNMPAFSLLTHPFKRWVSTNCKVLYEKPDSTEARVKICSSCNSMKQDQGEFPVKHEGKDYKECMAPSDFLEMDYHEFPDKPFVTQDKDQRRKKVKKREAKAGKTKCELCGEEFKFSFQMRNHLVQAHQWGIFTCHVCLYVLFHPDELSKHIFEKHSTSETTVCAKCPSCKEEVFLEDETTLAEHYSKCSLMSPKDKKEKEEQSKIKEKIVCDTCGLELSSRQALTAHMYRHTGEFPYKCDFGDCDKAFRVKHLLKSHRERHEREASGLPPLKKVLCNLCGKTFSDKWYLKQHVTYAHERKSLDVKCTECHLVFVHRRQMYKHKNLVHFPDKHRCGVCFKSFGDGKLLKKHMEVHEPEGKFECELCGSKMKKKETLEDHMRVHRGEKPYPCPFCDYRSTSSSLLLHHKKRIHPGEWDRERREKEDARIKVTAETLQKAAEAAGVGPEDPSAGGLIPKTAPDEVGSVHSDVQSPMGDHQALNLGMPHQQHPPHPGAEQATSPPITHMPPMPRPHLLAGGHAVAAAAAMVPFGMPPGFPDGFPKP